ncbi:MAG: prepilin-type N-terminal cleavage/methylation domain-containing protein [Armatimonadetes bacterium]|nr:prepilin-type N-terminal cleavage/methylation domain-containing protein [Armatimonadota bacterium]
MCSVQRRKRESGFTLIELLVVIAIIAILAAILFPVFSAAKAAGKQAACINNAGQVGKAMTLYLQDYNGFFPDVRRFGNNFGLFCLDYRGVASLLSKKYLGGPKKGCSKAYFCPTDPFGKAFNPFTNQIEYQGTVTGRTMVSYMYRLAFAAYNVSPLSQGKMLNESNCFRPTKQVLFHEIAAWHHGNYWAWQEQGKVQGQPYIVAIAVDGHVKLWKLPYITATGKPDGPPDDFPYDANWFTMGPRGPLGGYNHQSDPTQYWDMNM